MTDKCNEELCFSTIEFYLLIEGSIRIKLKILSSKYFQIL